MDRSKQIKIVHILKSKHGLDDKSYRSMLSSMFGVESSTLLDDIQLSALIAKLNTFTQNTPGAASQKQLLYIEGLLKNSPINNVTAWIHKVLQKPVKLPYISKLEAIKVIDALKRYSV